jgi:hypothetical protein
MIAVLVTTDERPARASAEATESSFVVEAGALLDAVVEAEMLSAPVVEAPRKIVLCSTSKRLRKAPCVCS